jgi:hypothetical protein
MQLKTRALMAIGLAGVLAVMLAAGGAAGTAPAKVTARCLQVGRKMVVGLGPVGSRNGPFYRAVVRQGKSLAIVRHFIHDLTYVAEVKALRPGRAMVGIERRYFTGGIRLDTGGQSAAGGRHSFYSSWHTVRTINFVVSAGPCPH